MNIIVPTKESYESALETVRKYEKRQAQLKYLEDQLSSKLSRFNQVKYKINKKDREVLFSGLHNETGNLLIGKSVCSKEDKFEVVIGKLIAVKKALNEDVAEVTKLVERETRITLNSGGLFVNGSALRRSDGYETIVNGCVQ